MHRKANVTPRTNKKPPLCCATRYDWSAEGSSASKLHFLSTFPTGVPDECVQVLELLFVYVCLYQFLPHPDSETKPMCQAG